MLIANNWVEVVELAGEFIQFLEGDNFLVNLIHRIKIILLLQTSA